MRSIWERLSFWVGLIGGSIGAIGGVIVAIGGYLLVWDRVTTPRLELVEALPVAIAAPRVAIGAIEKDVFGVSVILRCRAGSRVVFISGLDLVGRKYLSAKEFIPPDSDGKTLEEVEADIAKRKPYQSISWSGWPEEQRTAIRLEPYEERYVRFVFLAPEPFLFGQVGGPPHIGYGDGTKQPVRIKVEPTLFDMFKLRLHVEKRGNFEVVFLTPYGLRDEFRNGSLAFQLRIGPNQVPVPPEKVIGFRLITVDDWKSKDAQELFHGSPLGFRFNPNTEEGKAGEDLLKRHHGVK